MNGTQGHLITEGIIRASWHCVIYEEAGQWAPGELPPHSHDPVTQGFLKQRHRVNYEPGRG